MTAKSCCTPSAQRVAPTTVTTVTPADTPREIDVVAIPGGAALIGTDFPVLTEDEESPCRTKTLKPFHMMRTTVTNAMFAAFVEDTSYITEAEKYGWSFVFYSDVADSVPETEGVVGTTWWRKVDGADWRLINGPGSEGCLSR